MQVSCSCDVGRRCALGFCEDAILRARFVGRARQVTQHAPEPCSTRGSKRGGPTPLLQQVDTIGRSVNTQGERAIVSRVNAAEIRLWSRTHLVPDRMDMTGSGPQSKTRRSSFVNGVARSHNHMRRVGSATG